MRVRLTAAVLCSAAALSCRAPAPSGAGSPAAEVNLPPRAALLVDPAWVEAHRGDPDLRLIDLRPEKEYAAGHIPGAVRLEERSLRDPRDASGYLPPPGELAALLGKAGIGDSTRVVIYDADGGHFAARLWYVLEALGHERASLLDGGFPRWKGEGRPVTAEVPEPAPAVFTPRPVMALSCPSEEAGKQEPGRVILDVRSAREWRDGRIPGAVNVEWKENVSGPYLEFKPDAELRSLYAAKGITPDKEVVTYCASGARASHSLFALKILGYPRVRVYYGSWGDWSKRPGAPVEK